MYRRNGNRNANQIMLEYIDSKVEANRNWSDAKIDTSQNRNEDRLIKAMKELAASHAEIMEKMEARLAADRLESEKRQQATETRLDRERMEFRSNSRWLRATFFAVIIGMVGIFATIVIAIVATVMGLGS